MKGPKSSEEQIACALLQVRVDPGSIHWVRG